MELPDWKDYVMTQANIKQLRPLLIIHNTAPVCARRNPCTDVLRCVLGFDGLLQATIRDYDIRSSTNEEFINLCILGATGLFLDGRDVQ